MNTQQVFGGSGTPLDFRIRQTLLDLETRRISGYRTYVLASGYGVGDVVDYSRGRLAEPARSGSSRSNTPFCQLRCSGEVLRRPDITDSGKSFRICGRAFTAW